MLYSSQAIANRFLEISSAAKEPMDPMKIQKLVYFAHGWHLGFEEGALSSELVQAWQWGPVFPELYHAVKGYGSGHITHPLTAIEFDGSNYDLTQPTVYNKKEFEYELIDRIWEVYGNMSGPDLSQLTHQEDTPWRQIKERYPSKRHVVIPNSLIKEYFKQKIDQHASESGSSLSQ